MAKIKLTELKKTYPSGAAGVSGVNMEIADGEFTVVTGIAGSGKSALVRTICGLDDVTSGEVVIDGVVVNDVQPKDRDIAVVAKSVTLNFAQSVFENLAYGLKLRKVAKEDIDKRVNEVARILSLSEVLSRKPKNISTLERERVCIGRAIARRPKIVIFDEPFSDFNDSVRSVLCEDILKLQKRMKINFIYVTKNPVEAIELADKIAYFEKGELVQYDSVDRIYDSPKTIPLARSIGKPPINLFIGKFEKDKDLKFVSEAFTATIDGSIEDSVKEYIGNGKKVQLALRAEDISLGSLLKGKAEDIEDHGDKKILAFSLSSDASAHYALVEGDFVFKKGEEVFFDLDLSNANFYDFKNETNLIK